jgi:hypothetical protein
MKPDLGTIIVLLDRKTKHWTLQCVNSAKHGRRYECNVWACGKRFSTNRRTPLEAARAALERVGMLPAELKIAEHST